MGALKIQSGSWGATQALPVDTAHRLSWEAQLILRGRIKVRFRIRSIQLAEHTLLGLSHHHNPTVSRAARAAVKALNIGSER